MRAYVLPYRVLFHDTMAYGTHHFLTNLKFQCLAREHYYFGEVVHKDPTVHDGHLVLTREAYSVNLAPVAVGERVAILMTVEAFGERSVRLCFRVFHEDGRPVCAGYQTMIRVDQQTGALRGSPDWVRDACETIREPLTEPDLAAHLHAGRLDDVFDERARSLAAEVWRTPDLPADGGYLGLPQAHVGPAPHSARTAFVFPGQGSFDAAAMRALATGPSRSTVQAADAITREMLHASLLELAGAPDPSAVPGATALAQVAMVVTSVCAARAHIAAGTVPDVVAGHSFGEIAALTVAGAFDLQTAVRIVCARTSALAELGSVGGMLAVLGDGELARRTATSLPGVQVAVVNHAEQLVLSGPFAALEAAEARMASVGLTTRRVRSPVPFHCALLRPAVGPFARAISQLDLSAPSIPVFSPIEGGWLHPDTALGPMLAEQLVRPVCWPDAVAALQQLGVTTVVECGGRPVLSALTRRSWPDPAVRIIGEAPPPRSMYPDPGEPIAIVGMGCVTANAVDPRDLWAAVLEGRSGLSDAGERDSELALDFLGPDTPTSDKTTTLLGGFITHFEPAASLGAWADGAAPTRLQATLGEALVQARAALSVDPERTLVLVGSTADGHHEYDEALLLQDLLAEVDALGGRKRDRAKLRARVTEVLDAPVRPAEELAPHAAYSEVVERVLEPGVPVVALDAACASSLYAIDQAVRTLRAGDADLVLAGGAFSPGPANACLFSQFGGLSGTGSRPLDAGADGVVFGDGAAMLALRRLSDAVADQEHIYAVIREVGTSSDGRGPSVTVPQKNGQVLAMRRAWDRAQLDPDSAGLLEAHATSTPVGDTVELRAMGEVFGGATARPVGSIKALTGHTGWAAGAVSVIKTVGALTEQVIPPQPQVHTPNPELAVAGLTAGPGSTPWAAPPHGPRRAGVNGFGFGGSNAHVIVEAYDGARPEPVPTTPVPQLAVVAVALTAADEARELPPGPRVLPDVIDALDPSHLLALHGARRVLPEGWEQLRARIGVVLGLSGKTHAGRRATLRLYLDRLQRRLRVENGVSQSQVDALLERLEAEPPTGPYTLPGLMANVAAGRVASFFDLHGPTLVVDAGTATLPRALEAAARSLCDGACEVVVAGCLDADTAITFAVTTHAVAEARGLPVLASIDVRSQVPEGEVGSEPRGGSAGFEQLARAIGHGRAQWLRWRPAPPAEGSGIAIRIAPPASAAAAAAMPLPPLLRAEPVLSPAPIPAEGEWHGRRVLLVTDAEVRPEAAAVLTVSEVDLSDDASARASLEHLDPARFDTVVVLQSRHPTELGATPLAELAFVVARWGARELAAGELTFGTVCVQAVRDGELHPASGALGGLAKALAREFPATPVRALVTDADVAEGWQQLAHELANGPAPDCAEAVVVDGQRHVQTLRERIHLSTEDGPSLSSDSVVLATGGGSGVTAALLLSLAARVGMHCIVLGRSDPSQLPAEIRDLDDDAFATHETTFYRDGVAGGDTMPELRTRFARLAARRETARTLAALQTHGGSVHYAAVDLLDAPAVAAAIADAVEVVGAPDLVIHGAGVQSSGQLASKSLHDFRRTLQTKLGGLQAVLDGVAAAGAEPPRVHLLGSVFSFFGNDGQHGYGAANETLHRLARWHAEDGYSGVAWPGWRSLGMTRGSEYAEVARARRLRPLDVTEGTQLALEMLEGPATPLVMPVSAGELAWSGTPLAPELLATWPKEPDAHPFALDHLVAGQPTLPGTFGFEGVVRELLAASPGWSFVSGHDLFWGRFVRLQGPGTLRVEAQLLQAAPDRRRVRLRLLSDFVHASGTVLRRGVEHFSVTVVLRRSNPGVGPAPTLRWVGGGSTADPFCSPAAAPVRLTGPFACVTDLQVGPSGQRATWRVPDPDGLAALAHMSHPALLADAVCRVAMTGPGSDGDVPVPFRCRRFVVAPGLNDTTLVAAGVDVQIVSAPCHRSADRRIAAWALALDRATGRTLLRLDGLVGRHAGPQQQDPPPRHAPGTLAPINPTAQV